MANSKVEVANIALIGLRGNVINSFDDDSTEARAVKLLWDTVRRNELAKHPWNFAIKRAQLAQLTSTPAFGYKYEYQLPSDHLRTLDLSTTSRYKEEGRKVLIDDEGPLYIKYVYDNTDISTWTGSFTDLMAARLRIELAYTLAADKTMLDLAHKLYREKAQESRWIDASQDTPDRFSKDESTLIRVRY